MTNPPKIHVGRAWRLILRDIGVDERAVLRRAGQPLSLFEGEGTELSLDAYFALHRAVEQESDIVDLALSAGQVISVELFDPALFAALCSPDMNTAARRLGGFKRLVGAFCLDVHIGARETRITYRCKSQEEIPLLRGLSELVFLIAFARRATRDHIVPRRVEVQEMPSDPAPYQEYFGCALQKSNQWSVSLDAVDAKAPFLTHNEPMWDVFEPTLRRRMNEATSERSVSEQVEQALLELLPSGRAHLKDVAREVGIGTRTLQRRLASEDTSWVEMLGRTRERLARHYFSNTQLSATEVSFLLGYDDPNSLFRAFQRWTGTTPETWRNLEEKPTSTSPPAKIN